MVSNSGVTRIILQVVFVSGLLTMVAIFVAFIYVGGSKASKISAEFELYKKEYYQFLNSHCDGQDENACLMVKVVEQTKQLEPFVLTLRIADNFDTYTGRDVQLTRLDITKSISDNYEGKYVKLLLDSEGYIIDLEIVGDAKEFEEKESKVRGQILTILLGGFLIVALIELLILLGLSKIEETLYPDDDKDVVDSFEK